MDGLPDPLDLDWPRRTARLLLRPVQLGDVDAMLSYRSDPEVCRFLAHDPFTRDEVEQRVRGRLSGVDPTPGRLVRGVSELLGDDLVGDAMLRVHRGDPEAAQLWIGYALHPRVWGQGVATEVAGVLRGVGQEMGLTVWAETHADNHASRCVLTKVGLRDLGPDPADPTHHVFTDSSVTR